MGGRLEAKLVSHTPLLAAAALAAVGLLVACGNDGGTDGRTATADAGTPASTAGETQPPPEGFILYRDGLGDIVALNMRSNENYSYGVDVTSEVIIAAECAPGGDRIAYLRQDFDETDRQLRIEGTGEPLEFPLPPGTQGITWAPDGDRIAYVTFEPQAGYTLATIDLATGESTQQVRGLGIASSPRWSPDGYRIAFHAPSALTEQIWTYEVDSGAERPTMVTDGDGAFDPEWTPDGQSLIMSAVAEDETFQIFEVDPDTGETEAITDSADIFKRLPRYSPGGDAIAYTGSIVVPQVSRAGDSLHSFGIFLMGNDGSNERPLTADPRENPGAQVDPYLDAILIGWCAHGDWLNDTWTIREATPTPAIQ